MKQDALDALSGTFPSRIPSKETLDHPGIINHVCGFDVYDDTPLAFDSAWRKLGIDIHSARPGGNAPRPKVPGGTWEENGVRYSDYGVYPTGMPVDHQPDMAKKDEGWVWNYDTTQDDFDVDERSAELCGANADFREHYGGLAVHYHLYYTTLFMWPVVKFDWEPFMLAAGLDPERFDEQFWQPWAAISRKHCETLAAMDEEVVFTHDDIATGEGPVFRPEFYEKYIFPKYEHIWEPIFKAGKKLVFVADGNVSAFLERLLEFPIAGIMYENPATPYDRVLETWGRAGRGFIGGISTVLLTNGTPDEVRAHTRETIEKGREYPGFIISSCGQLPGTIPMENILAYFETRNEMGIPADLPPT